MAEKIETRICKTCGETKPLEGFNAIRNKGVKTYYYNSCKTCRNKEVKQKRMEKRAEKRASGEADTMWTEYRAMPATRLREHIRAAREACPILGFSLWMGDVPKGWAHGKAEGHLTCPTVDKWRYLNRRTVCESGKFQTASEEAAAKRIEWFEREK